MKFRKRISAPSELGARVGIAIKKITADQDHVGILYAEDGISLRFCHLAYHLDLRDEVAPIDYFAKACSIDEMTSEILVAQIINIRDHAEVIAYGFGFSDEVFDSSGTLIGLRDPGSGLTCATFVMVVFSSVGLNVCDIASWRARPEDAHWQRNMMKGLITNRAASCHHVWPMRKYVGSSRFRPDEVAVSATNPGLPVNFEDAQRMAIDLQKLLKDAA